MSDNHKNIKRLYWDSNVFLSAINANPERLPVINAILDDCDHGEVEIYTSVLSVTEVAFAEFEKRDRLLAPQIEAKINKLWLPPSPIRLEELSHHIANDARIMMRQAVEKGWSLKPPDAIHLATAKRRAVHEFQTYDTDRLSKYDAVVGLKIVQPTSDRLPFSPSAGGNSGR